MAAVGLGAQVGVMLPYSRSHETEADVEGLRYLIRAGYRPEEAPLLWERMAKLGSSGPTWLSTHPDPIARAAKMREMIPVLKEEEKGWRGPSGTAAASTPTGAQPRSTQPAGAQPRPPRR